MRELTSGKDSEIKDYSAICVTDFNEPGHFIDATKAYYLKGSRINSPMGANISAYSSKDKAVSEEVENGGDVINWTELKKAFSENN